MRTHTFNRFGKLIATFAIGTLVVLLQAGAAKAATLVFDDFDGSSATNLVGTTADVGGTWIGAGNTDTKADGTQASVAGSAGERVAYQAFTFVQGRTYTLSADVKVDTGSAAFVGIGFNNGGLGGTDSIWNASDPYAWAYLNAAVVHGIKSITQHVGGANEQKIGDTTLDTFVNLKIELDTTNASNYSATWYINDIFAVTRDIGSGPSLTHVFLNFHNDTSGAVDNFLLIDNAIPAPAALPAGLAMLGLVAMRRRRK